jgi:hypothetical protein
MTRPPFILAQKLSGEREGADSPLAPVDAKGGETFHMPDRST